MGGAATAVVAGAGAVVVVVVVAVVAVDVGGGVVVLAVMVVLGTDVVVPTVIAGTDGVATTGVEPTVVAVATAFTSDRQPTSVEHVSNNMIAGTRVEVVTSLSVASGDASATADERGSTTVPGCDVPGRSSGGIRRRDRSRSTAMSRRADRSQTACFAAVCPAIDDPVEGVSLDDIRKSDHARTIRTRTRRFVRIRVRRSSQRGGHR